MIDAVAHQSERFYGVGVGLSSDGGRPSLDTIVHDISPDVSAILRSQPEARIHAKAIFVGPP